MAELECEKLRKMNPADREQYMQNTYGMIYSACVGDCVNGGPDNTLRMTFTLETMHLTSFKKYSIAINTVEPYTGTVVFTEDGDPRVGTYNLYLRGTFTIHVTPLVDEASGSFG